MLGETEGLFKSKHHEDIKMKKIRVLADSYLENFKVAAHDNFQKALKILDDCNEMVKGIESNEGRNSRSSEEMRQSMEQILKDMEVEIRQPLKRLKI